MVDDSSCVRMNIDSMPSSNGEPDSDSIKMFVGHLPKSMDEAQIREMLKEYGPIYSITVLRNKTTGISKGCCFVRFYTRCAAFKAQDALHNVKILNGMRRPIQMKPAEGESCYERKLFVNMLNKTLNENDVRKLFEIYGVIEDCCVLRDQNGESKCCAFVTFCYKYSAVSAFKMFNQFKTMKGCTSQLVVKFADTPKEKEQKRMLKQQMQENLWNFALNRIKLLGQANSIIKTSIMGNSPQQVNPLLGADVITPDVLQLLQQNQVADFPQQTLQGLQPLINLAVAFDSLLPSMTLGNLAPLKKMFATGITSNSITSGSMATFGKFLQYGGSTFSTSLSASDVLIKAAATVAGKKIKGPEGCNLFISYLPHAFTDRDLASIFLPFGNIISAKVIIDKQTNLSKSFGFVLFDNPESAQVAIKTMNGLQIGIKRLKVELTKPKRTQTSY